MIGKMSKGNDISGLVAYLMREKGQGGELREMQRIIGGTVPGKTLSDLVSGFRYIQSAKPDLKNAVINGSLRLPEDESLSEQQWREVGEKWAEKMGFDTYAIFQHSPREIHVAALRITGEGKAVSDSNDFARSERIIRQLEQEYGLEQVASSHLLNREAARTHKKAPTREQINMHARTEKVAPSILLQQALDQALSEKITASEFVDFLENRGINVRANIASTGKLNGFSYEIDGQVITAKALGKGYTLKNLQERGLDYEQSRDAERLRRTLIGGALRADVELEISARGDRASGEITQGAGGAISQRPDPARVVDGDTERQADGDHAGDREDSQRGHDAARGLPEAGQRVEDVAGGAARRPQTGPRKGSDLAGTIAALDLDKSSDAVRVIGGISGAGLHRVEAVVEATIKALPSDKYEVGLLRRDVPDGMMKKEYTGEQLMRAIPYLRRENANGKEVTFRPTDTAYVLIDDLNDQAVDQMKSNGMKPALVVETSAGNLQAWLRLPKTIMSSEITMISRELTQQLGGDPAAVGPVRLGKLPGFTNRKPQHEYERGGRLLAPFVKLREAAGVVIERGQALISWAQERMAAEQKRRRERAEAVERAEQAAALSEVKGRYEAERQRVIERRRTAGKSLDESAIDFTTCAQLLKKGEHQADLIEILQSQSDRKVDAADYARRTVEQAAKSEIVQGRSRGPRAR